MNLLLQLLPILLKVYYWLLLPILSKGLTGEKNNFLRYLNYQDHTTGTTFEQKIKNKRPKKGQHQHAVVNK